MTAKKKPIIEKPSKAHSCISVTINGAYFEAEGSPEEVGKKLDAFLDQLLSPLKQGLKQLRGGKE